MKKFSILLIMIGIIMGLMCSCTNASDSNVDDRIVETSNEILEAWGPTEGRTFSVVVDDQNIYHVDIDGEEMLVKIENDENSENKNTKSNITECNSEILGGVEASKELVINYINESNILKDKDELVNYIKNLSVQIADFATDEAVEYDPEFNAIFINNQNSAEVCAYTITHELVYALSQKTIGGVENKRYQNSTFDEVLTAIITYWLHPECIDDIYMGKYDQYELWGDFYLGCVGMDGIEAYFYGYDKILEKIPEAELDIFVNLLEDVNDSEDAVIVLTNCINEWGLEK